MMKGLIFVAFIVVVSTLLVASSTEATDPTLAAMSPCRGRVGGIVKCPQMDCCEFGDTLFSRAWDRSAAVQDVTNRRDAQLLFVKVTNTRINEAVEEQSRKERRQSIEELQELRNLHRLEQEGKVLDEATRRRLLMLEVQYAPQGGRESSPRGEMVAAVTSLHPATRVSANLVIGLYRSLYADWDKYQTDDLFEQLAGAIYLVGDQLGVVSSVTINSKNAGATVKYQTAFEHRKGSAPLTAKCPTKCTEIISVGYYHIWLEREGKVTSDPGSKFYIKDKKEEVEIVERYQ